LARVIARHLIAAAVHALRIEDVVLLLQRQAGHLGVDRARASADRGTRGGTDRRTAAAADRGADPGAERGADQSITATVGAIWPTQAVSITATATMPTSLGLKDFIDGVSSRIPTYCAVNVSGLRRFGNRDWRRRHAGSAGDCVARRPPH
jgi:hypothetical protein